jgi:hypothetical protein
MRGELVGSLARLGSLEALVFGVADDEFSVAALIIEGFLAFAFLLVLFLALNA